MAKPHNQQVNSATEFTSLTSNYEDKISAEQDSKINENKRYAGI